MLTPSLHRDDGWLLYVAALPELRTGDAESLLSWSGELSGGCKFARSSSRSGLCVRAELPALAESPERIARIQSGFSEASARLGLGATRVATHASLPIAASPDVASLCRETAWNFEERGDGILVIDLAVAGAYVPALIEARADCVAVEVDIVCLPEANDVCRAALLALLLRVNAAFRMARAVLRGPEPRALLEVRLPRTTTAAELGESIAAIAVAARRSALEARVIATDARIARASLEADGMTPFA